MKVIDHLRAEDGGIIVAGAVLMVVLILLGIGFIQVGGWFQDRRHLQVRADAGALAGAELFNECFEPKSSDDPTVDIDKAKADMETAASEYAGFGTYGGLVLPVKYNDTFSTGTNAIAFQSNTYPGGGGDAPDDTQNGVNECDPNNLALDVKLTRDVGGWFSFSPLATVHAHARVQLKEVQSLVPSFPLAVPEIVPGAVAVTFVNEDTAAELTGCSGPGLLAGTTCTFQLQDIASINAPGSDPFNLGPWCIVVSGACAPAASVNLPAFAAGAGAVKHIGMRVGVGDPSAVQSCAAGGNGTTWACFNADTGTSTPHGVVMIDEVNPTQTGAAKLLGVWPTTCSGTPFAGDPALTSPCAATITADIDFGSAALNKVTVTATVTQDNVPNGTKPQTFTLSHQTGNTWSAPLDTATAAINVEPATGGSEYSIDLAWKINGGGNGDFGVVQRFVGATNADDGPLDAVSLTDSTGNGAYSFSGGGARNLNVSVKLQAPFNKLTILRQAFSGSATSFILCRWKDPSNPGALEGGDPGIKDGIRLGCQVPYTIKADPSVACVAADEAPANLTPDCTENKPMSAGGNPIAAQLDLRFGCSNGTALHKNLWPEYGTPGDPRAVTLITTSYGAFSKGGSSNYPVTGFGAFYIAGYSGNSCGDPWPLDNSGNPILGPEPKPNSGTIWGYFIKYTNNDATPSGVKCNVNSFNNCVAVLTR